MRLTWFKKYFAPPVFAEQEKNRIAATLNVILLTLLATALFLIGDDWLTRRGANFPAMFFLGLFVLASLWLTRRGQLRLPRLLTPLIVLAVVSYIIYVNNLGVHDIAMLSYPAIIILAGLLLGKQAPLIFAGLCLGAIAVIRYAEIQGGQTARLGAVTDFSILISISVILGMTAAITYILMHNLMASLAFAQRNEAALTESHRQLQAYTQQLEQQEHALRESEKKYRLLAENLADVIWTMNMQLQVTYISPSIEKLSGWPPEQWLSFQLQDFLTPQSLAVVLNMFADEVKADRQAGDDFRTIVFEAEHYRKDGATFWAEITGRFMRSAQGEIVGMIGVTRDITERRRVETQIRAALQEKEVLLREIHHRVKNNLQVISSLLNLQARTLSAECGRSAFDESQHRIKAMALIHEKLYQSESLTRIDFKDYTTALVRHLRTSYGVGTQAIRFDVQVDQVDLTIDLAIPCGLIINELVSNAFKYAFPQGQGTIKIALTKTAAGLYEFMISDDGVGMPEDLNLDRLDSLGLQLVRGLAEEQLEGMLHLTRHPGTTWRIEFPAAN